MFARYEAQQLVGSQLDPFGRQAGPVALDQLALVLATLGGEQARAEEVGDVAGPGPEADGLPVDGAEGRRAGPGAEEHVLEAVVAVQQRQRFVGRCRARPRPPG